MWELPAISFKSAEFGLKIDLTLTIDKSSLDVACAVENYDTKDLGHIHKIAYDLARAAVNLSSFCTGMMLSPVFDRFVGPDGTTSPFVIHDPELAKLCTAFAMRSPERPSSLSTVMHIVLSEPPLFMALDDLIGAASLHHQSSANCGRAVEGLRNLMASPVMSRSDAWALFQKNLRVDKGYLTFITDNSQAGRHGDRTYVPGDKATEIVHRSWIIMNRFLEYRKRGNQPLPVDEFPILTG